MSEYQYYEFQAIDRPLTEAERKEIGGWSNRTHPTSTQAIFTYSYGDFPKSEEEVVANYFDAMLYVANWGSRRLIFRLPHTLVDKERLLLYCFEEMVNFSETDTHIILDISWTDEDGGYWIEGEGMLSSMINLRADLLNGDYRMLYLAWLNAIYHCYEAENYYDEPEPPVPDSLQKLSGPLKTFCNFFEIDDDLLEIAAEKSKTIKDTPAVDIKKAITRLSEAEKDDFLLRLAKQESHLSLKFLKRLEKAANKGGAESGKSAPRRTIRELLTAAEKLSKKKIVEAEKKAEVERIAKLEKRAREESQLWEKTSLLIDQKKDKAYKEAVEILLQLKELYEYLNQQDQFQVMIDQIYVDYSRLSSFKNHLRLAEIKESTVKKIR